MSNSALVIAAVAMWLVALLLSRSRNSASGPVVVVLALAGFGLLFIAAVLHFF